MESENLRISLGCQFNLFIAAITLSWVISSRFLPLGKYCLNSPLVFHSNLVPSRGKNERKSLGMEKLYFWMVLTWRGLHENARCVGETTIFNQCLPELSRSDLQRLVAEGADRFTKMVLLYREYKDKQTNIAIKGESLTDGELREIDEYIKLYKENNCKEHYEVNQIISNKGEWDKFKNIRSLNDHGPHKGIPGIQPKYFKRVMTRTEAEKRLKSSYGNKKQVYSSFKNF